MLAIVLLSDFVFATHSYLRSFLLQLSVLAYNFPPVRLFLNSNVFFFPLLFPSCISCYQSVSYFLILAVLPVVHFLSSSPLIMFPQCFIFPSLFSTYRVIRRCIASSFLPSALSLTLIASLIRAVPAFRVFLCLS